MKELLNKVKLSGTTDGELFYKTSTKRSISFDNNNLKGSTMNQSTGVALRIVKDGKISTATSTDLNNFDNMIKNCEDMSPFSSSVEFEFVNKLQEESIVIPENSVMEISDERFIDDGNKIVSEITKEFNDVMVGAEFQVESTNIEICNTKGLYSGHKKDILTLGVYGSFIKDNKFIGCGQSKKLFNHNYNIDEMISNILEELRLCRTAAKPKLGRRTVIFTPEFLYCTLIPFVMGISGKNIMEGSSPLKEKLGKQIFDERFNIVDDATIFGGINTQPVDHEGIPCKRIEIIKNGCLQSFIHSLKTASKLNMEPTGSAYKMGRFFPTFDLTAEPSPYISNFYVEPGRVSFEDMVLGLKDGVIIDSVMGFMMGNLENGEITGSIGNGYEIENGKIVGMISGQSVNFNVYDIFKNNLVEISSTTRDTGFFYSYGSTPIPYAMFKDINIS